MIALDDFSGVFTALITPFVGGALDETVLRRLVEAQIEAGIAGLVVGGTIGEGFALTASERERLLVLVVEAAAGRLPIVAEIGTNSTAHSVDYAITAARLGASAIILPTPYYNKPSQDGIERHTRAVSEAVEIPVLLTGCLDRAGVGIAPNTLDRLADLGALAGYVETSASIERMAQINLTIGRRLPVWSANDILFTGCLCALPRVFVSAVANFVPRGCVRLFAAIAQADLPAVFSMLEALAPLALATGDCDGVARVKCLTALVHRGLRAEPRLPLLPLDGDPPDFARRMMDRIREVDRRDPTSL